MSKTEMFAGHKDPLGFFGKLAKVVPKVYTQPDLSVHISALMLMELSDVIKENLV